MPFIHGGKTVERKTPGGSHIEQSSVVQSSGALQHFDQSVYGSLLPWSAGCSSENGMCCCGFSYLFIAFCHSTSNFSKLVLSPTQLTGSKLLQIYPHTDKCELYIMLCSPWPTMLMCLFTMSERSLLVVFGHLQ